MDCCSITFLLIYLYATVGPSSHHCSNHFETCRLFVRDKRKLKTQVKENTTRPTWNEEFQLLIHEPDHQHLTLEMFDHDVLSVDDEIGRGSFAIHNLRNGIEEEVEIEIKEQMGQQVDQMMVSARL